MSRHTPPPEQNLERGLEPFVAQEFSTGALLAPDSGGLRLDSLTGELADGTTLSNRVMVQNSPLVCLRCTGRRSRHSP